MGIVVKGFQIVKYFILLKKMADSDSGLWIVGIILAVFLIIGLLYLMTRYNRESSVARYQREENEANLRKWKAESMGG